MCEGKNSINQLRKDPEEDHRNQEQEYPKTQSDEDCSNVLSRERLWRWHIDRLSVVVCDASMPGCSNICNEGSFSLLTGGLRFRICRKGVRSFDGCGRDDMRDLGESLRLV